MPPGQPCRERLALDQLHHKVVEAYVVQRADVRVIQSRDCASLTAEALAELVVCDFEGNRAIEASVRCLVDAPMPPAQAQIRSCRDRAAYPPQPAPEFLERRYCRRLKTGPPARCRSFVSQQRLDFTAEIRVGPCEQCGAIGGFALQRGRLSSSICRPRKDPVAISDEDKQDKAGAQPKRHHRGMCDERA